MEDIIDQEDISVILDFCRETEDSLEKVEESILILKQYVYPIPKMFSMPDFFNFFQGTNFEIYLEAIRNLNRLVHTIKGVSAFIGMDVVNQYCHELEEMTLSLSKGDIILDPRVYNIVEKTTPLLNRFLEEIKDNYTDKDINIDSEIEEIKAVHEDVKKILNGAVIHFDEMEGKDFGRVRKFDKKLDIKISLEEYDKIVNNYQAFIQEGCQMLAGRGVDSDLILQLKLNMTAHLDSMISSSLGKIVLSRYGRIVKDLSHSLNKKIKFTIVRNDALARPDLWDHCHNALVHLVRNSVDHGIEEFAEDRTKRGKPEEGNIELEIFEDFKNIYIIVRDDGKGIDGDKIAQKAIEKGVLTQTDVSRMSNQQKQELIFMPDFSSREVATKVSGRGVGMDAVKKEIEDNLRGITSIKSELYKGTELRLEIPKKETLTECIIFGDDEYKYAIPIVADVNYLECDEKFLSSMFDTVPIYTKGDMELPVLNLFCILHPEKYNQPKFHTMPIIKIGNEDQPFGILVPDILGHERINVNRNSNLKTLISDSGLVFGYGITEPVIIVLDLDEIQARINT